MQPNSTTDREHRIAKYLDLQRQQIICVLSAVSPSVQCHTQVLHTNRINLSPFTKDFRVWGTSNDYTSISFRLSLDSFITA